MSESLKKLRIFAASPSDVTNERAKLETVVDSLKPMADYLGLTLEVVDWRSVVPDAGRPQQIIFDQLKPTSWDVFIGILWHRFGTPPGAKDKDGKDYLSGTEEEFKTAYKLWKQHGKPRMVLYRCTRALPFDVDPDQLKNVRAFFKLIEDTKGDYSTLYQAFDTTESFEKLAFDNLQKLLIEYGEQSKTPITPEVAQVLAPKIPNNLPRRQAFFGRNKEMEIVMRALSPTDRTWGVLVDGIGGIGKSAIAIEAAYRSQEAGMFEAFVFITAKQNILEPSGIRELNPPAHTLDEFLNETTHVLGQPRIAKLAGEEKRQAIIDVLLSMHTLLIYDNLETLSKEEQEGIADFLRELPQGCKAIITSRRRGGEGAVWLRVEQLDWDAARSIIENEMAHSAGLANKLRHKEAEARWQELFDETHGSPLALIHTLGLMRVRTSLTFKDALAMLRGNQSEDLQKFIFQEASQELTKNDKTALGALSFFVPSSNFEAWVKVAGLTPNALETTIDRLSALSLVDVLPGQERYTLHPLTRAFVRDELLADGNIVYKIGMQFAQYWIDYAEQYGGSSENYKTFHLLLETEWANLDAAANWLWETTRLQVDEVGDKDTARILNGLAEALNHFLWFGGRWDECLRLSTRAYEAMGVLNDWSKAGWHAYHVTWIHYNRAHTNDATLWANRCTDVWTRGGSKSQLAYAMRLQGLVAQQRDDDAEAERLLRDALFTLRDLKQDAYVALLLNDLGSLARKRKLYDMAEGYLRESLGFLIETDDRQGQANVIITLGNLERDRVRWARARNWYEQGLAIAEEIERKELTAHALEGLARVYEAEGQTDLALPLAQDALKIYRQLQHQNMPLTLELVERLLQEKR